MRLSILWSRLAGYTVAFFRELAQQQGCTLQLFYLEPGGHLKFEPFDLSFAAESQQLPLQVPAGLAPRVAAFKPDAVLMSGWSFKGYMQAARALRKSGVPVVSAVDNPWRGGLRQQLASAAAPWLLRPAISALYVCGERQAELARRFGFEQRFEGLYAADVERFRSSVPLAQRPNRFLFVGRLVERKGLAILLEAYALYRATAQDPMGLLVAGRGPLEEICRGAPGVELRPFVHPDELPRHFEQGQCLVLPSWLEHWGVVLHEAAAAGLPLIASEACGATVSFLRDGASGFRIRPRVDDLLRALRAFHELTAERRAQMGATSATLGASWTPRLQAEHFLSRVRSLQTGGHP